MGGGKQRFDLMRLDVAFAVWQEAVGTLGGRATMVALVWPLSNPPSSLQTVMPAVHLEVGLISVVGALLTYHPRATPLSYHAWHEDHCVRHRGRW